MDNRTALIVAIVLIALFGADIYFEWGMRGFLMDRIIDLIGWLAFWR